MSVLKKRAASFYFRGLAALGKTILSRQLSQQDFCIVSNDCYGGEIYRWLQLPYNTPFVGLMLMAPCYIQLLENLEYYLAQPLRFTNNSRYPDCEERRQHGNAYPVGLLDDVEIHFLHYDNPEIARDTWNRRRQRMNLDKLAVKFSMDKDHSCPEHLSRFVALPWQRKLSISRLPYPLVPENIQIDDLNTDAVVAFRQSLHYVDIAGWLNDGKINITQPFQRLRNRVLYFCFQR